MGNQQNDEGKTEILKELLPQSERALYTLIWKEKSPRFSLQGLG
jgi:hypothetical protein